MRPRVRGRTSRIIPALHRSANQALTKPANQGETAAQLAPAFLGLLPPPEGWLGTAAGVN